MRAICVCVRHSRRGCCQGKPCCTHLRMSRFCSKLCVLRLMPWLLLHAADAPPHRGDCVRITPSSGQALCVQMMPMVRVC